VAGTTFFVMEYMPGVLFKTPDMRLPKGKSRGQMISSSTCTAVYSNLAYTLALLHCVDLKEAGLHSLLRGGSSGQLKSPAELAQLSPEEKKMYIEAHRNQTYAARQIARWSAQFKGALKLANGSWTDPDATTKGALLDDVLRELNAAMPRDESIFASAIAHGDFRLDNCIIDPATNNIRAVLDWELAAAGHPIADLAYNCLPYIFPANNPMMPGLVGLNLAKLGIPTLAEFIAAYERHVEAILEQRSQQHELAQQLAAGQVRAYANVPDTTPPTSFVPIEWSHFRFYFALSLFRLASIVQGVYARAQQGSASHESAAKFGTTAVTLMSMALDVLRGKVAQLQDEALEPARRRWNDPTSPEALQITGFPFSDRFWELRAKFYKFMYEEVLPREAEFERSHRELTRIHGHPWVVPPVIEELKKKAQAQGLWNFFLPLNKDFPHGYGPKLTNLDYAPLCELTGRSPMLAPEIFNCNAPDTGNMEVLALHGTEKQKKEWLEPLLRGEFRSAYAMTEPAVASSDATNIALTAVREGDSYVLNGRKWWTSGALDPRCKVMIVMARTGVSAPRQGTAPVATTLPIRPAHEQHSMFIVPMNTPGIRVIRPLHVFGYDDAPHGHAEIVFADVKIPAENIILGEGKGFLISQTRLGPGRVHHCMRLIGMGERALETMLRRVRVRSTFGTPLASKGRILADIADMRIELEQCRLLVLHTAHLMDKLGNQKARQHIAMIKVAVPRTVCSIIDRAIQAHGGMGVCQDTVLPRLYAGARTLRLADGPDEVHQETIGKLELKKSQL